jgi:hypothetical protein
VVTRARTPSRAIALQWYALFGPPLAWAAQLVVGYGLTEAACGPPGRGWGIPMGSLELLIAAAAAVVAIGGWAAAAALHRAVGRGEIDDPLGRVRFLSTIGLVIGAVFLALILYTGAGVATLEGCRR